MKTSVFSNRSKFPVNVPCITNLAISSLDIFAIVVIILSCSLNILCVLSYLNSKNGYFWPFIVGYFWMLSEVDYLGSI
jgi:hypothetical protein